MEIITHGGFAHSDEFLAVSVILTKFPSAVVHRVSEVPEDINNAIVVDIGGKHDGERFFDHHHSAELPASLILVLRKFFPEIDIDNIDELQWVSDWDTMGPFKSQQKWNVRLPEFRDPIAEVILRLFSEAKIVKPGDLLHDMLIAIGSKFIELLKEQTEFLKKARHAEVFEVKGLRVARVDDNIPIRFVKKVHPDVAIVIQPNQRTKGAWTLTRVDDHPKVDFNRIRDRVPAHFVHATGFMAVVDPEHIEEATLHAVE
ncbi:MYG1 family protein [Archaeoglobus neptunius]|uniref:MYG1 family protein n=1 Tax=Archaeoglobus neptunius TaxID=2798580 RepID=UPI001925BE44|nr:MYG1 family protein [Archaeoglobus neptunius]